jgi:hypothetical protein
MLFMLLTFEGRRSTHDYSGMSSGARRISTRARRWTGLLLRWAILSLCAVVVIDLHECRPWRSDLSCKTESMSASPARTLAGARSVTGTPSFFIDGCFALTLDSHAMLVDQATEKVTVPLNMNLAADGRLELANSKSMVSTLPRNMNSSNVQAVSAKWPCSGYVCCQNTLRLRLIRETTIV